MRKLIFLLFALVCILTIDASPRDAQKARTIAASKAASLGTRLGSHSPAKVNGKLPAADSVAYYIFNFADSTGYAVVSGEDQMPAIVGYSSRGCLDADSMPVQLKDFLQAYEATVEAVRNNDSIAVKNVKAAITKRAAGSFMPVEPLLGGIVWNQGTPFNNQCPIYDGENRAVTGCVATAMAQIMMYWKYPAQLLEDIGTYEVNYINFEDGSTFTNTYGGISKGIAYDWDNMLENYNGDYTNAQADAVATLMSHCGLSVKMQYAGESGAYISEVPNALIKQFGYDEDLVQYLQRNLFEWDEWNEILQRELQAKRPIYYGGFASTGGHAFVCDGIDADGYYHINWGWGGMSDDYFDITILNPDHRGAGASASSDGYNSNNEIVIGITPDNGSKDEPLFTYNKLLQSPALAYFSKFQRNNETENFVGTIYSSFGNETNGTCNTMVTFALKNDDGSFTSIVKEPKMLSIKSHDNTNDTFDVDYCFPVGVHKIYGVQSMDNGTTWQPCYINPEDVLILKVTEQYIITPSDITTDSITIDKLKYKLSPKTFTATLVANDYAGDIIIPESITYEERTFPVTAIDDRCFMNCTSLTSVHIPETVTEIGYICFMGSSLSEIDIPNSVTRIESGCFDECTKLKSIKLPQKIAELPRSCFIGCTSLQEVSIPSSVIIIGRDCFASCKSLEKFIIPSTVRKLGAYCFSGCSSLKNMNIPDGIEELPEACFMDCTSLQEVSIPSSVKKLGNGCFANCGNLISIKLYDGVKEIDDFCFSECSALEEINIPGTVERLGYTCFGGCRSLKRATLQEGIKVLSNDCFNSCFALEEINIPSSVKRIGQKCFELCESLKRLQLPEGMTELPDECFFQCWNLEEINIPSSVTKLGQYCFWNCRKLKSLKIPEGITEFPDECFSQCFVLEEINIPSSVTKLGQRCFWNCRNLKSLKLPEGIKELPDECFSQCFVLEEINIPSSVTKLGQMVFQNCRSLKRLQLPEGIQELPDESFQYCFALAEINMPSTVTTLGQYCFEQCRSLKSLKLSEGINELPDGCFSSCSTLEEINIPSSVTKLGQKCFQSCDSLKSLKLPEGVKALADYTFQYCCALEDINIPSTVTTLGKYCFDQCHSLKNINIPSNVTSIGINCFQSCDSLQVINLPQGITELPDYCFAFCYKLKEINIPSEVSRIGDYSFRSCSDLQDVQLYEGLKEIGAEAFAGCSLKKIIIPQGVTAIGKCCFNWGSSLKYVDLPASISEIGERCFAWCGADTIICRATVCPPINDFTFFSTAKQDFVDGEIILIDPQPAKAILFVPKESVDAYKAAEGWKNFKTILPLETTDIDNAVIEGLNIDTNGNCITLSGLKNGTYVCLYSLDGKFIGGGIVSGGGALSVQTSESFVVAKIGNQTVKIAVDKKL